MDGTENQWAVFVGDRLAVVGWEASRQTDRQACNTARTAEMIRNQIQDAGNVVPRSTHRIPSISVLLV